MALYRPQGFDIIYQIVFKGDALMKICCIQMNMKLGCPDENFGHAAELIRQAAARSPDVILLPETWNTGFYPQQGLKDMAQLSQ